MMRQDQSLLLFLGLFLGIWAAPVLAEVKSQDRGERPKGLASRRRSPLQNGKVRIY